MVWLECELLSANDTHYTVRLQDGQQQSVERTKVQFSYRNRPEIEDSDNFLALPNLDEANILHSLRVRYWQNHVYSYSGKILLAVNPWRKVDIYGRDQLDQCLATIDQEPAGQRAPHIFATAVEAYKSMLATRASQCVLISGESGAGKTESTKHVLHVLTQAGTLSGSEARVSRRSVSEQIMLGNPVLEAFGNAKTQV
jgi:myosin heavy subunit